MSDLFLPCRKTVTALFEEQAQKNPHVIALQDKKTRYTYGELNKKVNQITQSLIKKSVQKGDFVSILLEPSTDFIISILAVVKLGAVYVPLDTLAPKTRLKEIINDTQPKLIITNKAFQLTLNELNAPLCLIKILHLESISYSHENINLSFSPEAPLYMIYTSGSTGKPKGVIIPHQAVVNMTVVENYARVQLGEVVAQFNNLAFDASTFELWSALLNGGTLSIIPLEARINYIELKTVLECRFIKYLLLPTGFFHQLIKSAPDSLNQAQTILFGGEQINPLLLRQFIEYRNLSNLPITLINGYGPSEGTTFACRHVISEQLIADDNHLSSIGRAFKNVTTYILDPNMNEALEGELHISGIHLALGYHNCPELNAQKFVPNPFCSTAPFQRLYKTGDLVKSLPNGDLLYTGRADDQVKVGGFRIHLGEIERQLMKHEAISLASVTVELGGGNHKMLTAYLVFTSKNTMIHADEIRTFLSHELPLYMLPAKYVRVDEFPLTLIGKVDKNKLHQITHTDLSFHIDKSSSSRVEETIKNIWKNLLNRTSIEVNKNLFDLGANSLLITEACSRINSELGSDLNITDLLTYPTIHKLSRYVEGDMDIVILKEKHPITSSDIAIIGMSCRFPKANTIDEFWENISEGKDCLTRFEVVDLNTNYVPAKGIISDIEKFDASFFNFSPIDARITDPQHRVFLECAWEALEHAAVVPGKDASKTISVFVGMTDSTYLQENLLKNNAFCQEHDFFHQRIATSTSMLSTQTSYRLNLKGRSVNVNTACSTGLIAVDYACQDLILGQSDIALAGASSITLPDDGGGYLYQQSSIVSPDGYCRPFSDEANGTVFSNGVGVVVLKRLDDAIKDNNTIYAVIKSRGVNNDGLDKPGFTAPSSSGQMACIKDALSQAQLTASDISMIEAHGTATALGDAIELIALSAVFREATDKKKFCALGSVKANIGHTDVTAGIAGLIKTTLCLYHKKIPPLTHFHKPNPNLSLDNGPFFVNTHLIDWNDGSLQRYAGVSSFGVGGTNIHMILSDFSQQTSVHVPLKPQEELILLSAKTDKALEEQAYRMRNYLNSSQCSDETLKDVAHTLQTGREAFQWRCFSVGKNRIELEKELAQKSPVFTDEEIHHSVIFMFSGQGAQYPSMAMELFDTVPRFQEYVKKGVLIATPYLNCDLLEIIRNPYSEQLTQTQFAQPALFIIEYALARLLMDCGIIPEALIGHSIGEYVAACLAGVFSFEDGVALVCERGLLMAHIPHGAMLAVTCTEEECRAYQIKAVVDVALHNATNHYVFSGDIDSIACLEEHLTSTNKQFQKLKVSHAFHSRMMASLEKPFKEIFSNITLSPPTLPIVSNLTGDWLSTQQAMDPDYWYLHLRHTVQITKGIGLLLHDEHPLFLEVGLGHALSSFVKEISNGTACVLNTLPNQYKPTSDLFQLLHTFGELWSKGISILLEPLYEHSQRHLIPLPSYAFQKQRYWVNPDKFPRVSSQHNRLYHSVWSREALDSVLSSKVTLHTWILFKDSSGIGQQVIDILSAHQVKPIIIESGTAFIHKDPSHFLINPTNPLHYEQVFSIIKELLHHNPCIIHCWSCDEVKGNPDSTKKIDEHLAKGFYSLLHMTQAYLNHIGAATRMRCNVITTGTQNISGDDCIIPVNASLTGFCRVIPLEHPALSFYLMDIQCNESRIHMKHLLMDGINRLMQEQQELISAYRNTTRWSCDYIPIKTNAPKQRLKDNGVYFITGGLGGMGLALSQSIASQVRHPTLILCSRTSYPEQEEWAMILKDKTHKNYDTICVLHQLKTQGAFLEIYTVDVTDERAINQLIHTLYQKFGTINGMIHAAGVPGGGLAQLKSQEAAHSVFLPKIHGTYYLAKASHILPTLDFVVLMSSIASMAGMEGQIDYCGANACLDAFAHSTLFHSRYTLSINWNTWRDAGMSFNSQHGDELDLFSLGNDISSAEGQALFLNALSSQYSQIIISNYDLITFQERLMQPHESNYLNDNKTSREDLNIKNSYCAPEGDCELRLSALWQDNLHIASIGRHDDFFSLGGHSLKALTLIEKINSAFSCSFSIQHLYKSPTIAELGQCITSGLYKQPMDIIVPLKESLAGEPRIFFCHPVSGMIYCFNALAAQWQLPYALYGLQDPSISAGRLLYESITTMAEQYAAAIKRIQPNGPYYLAGYSFGGTLVYEIAHLLKQEQQTIGLLALIESWCVFSETQVKEQQFIDHMLSSETQATKKLANLALKRMELLVHYKPSNTQQDIVLFKATQLNHDYQSIDDPLNGWAKYTQGHIICKTIDANHDTIINDKNIKTITNYLKQFLI